MTKIIAFEGIDGTGKSVQMARLAQKYRAEGKRVMELSFPCYESFFGGYVGRYLSARDGVAADTVDGKSMALWFALDRFEAFQKLDYKDCDVLLINRFVLSNAVYQGIRDCDLDKEDILDFVLELEHVHFGLPKPDRYLILDMDTDDAAHNVDKKGYREYVGNEKDVYEAHDSLQARARSKYLLYAKRIKEARVIGCMADGKLLSMEEIAKKIVSACEQ